MKNFIYKVLQEDTYWEKSIERSLNELGKEGWELITVIHRKSSDTMEAQYIFKKEIDIESPNILE